MIKDQKITNAAKKIYILIAICLSGFCWYFSNGLTGGFWFLLWLAPLPVLMLSLKVNARICFQIALISYLIGQLSWFSYLSSIIKVIPAAILILVFSIIFAIIVVLTRWIVISNKKWYSIFAFPLLLTAFECLLINYSPHGTAFSIAYSQMDCIPLIQIASITGILGITFIVSFIPSALAHTIYYRKDSKQLKYILLTSAVFVGGTFLYGFDRVTDTSSLKQINLGLLSLSDKSHSNSDTPSYDQERQVTLEYSKQINFLASKGAKLILLPERAIGFDQKWSIKLKSKLSNLAKQKHVFLIVGNTAIKDKEEKNAAIVFDFEGRPLVTYSKKYLIPGLESQFTAGKQIGLFKFNGNTFGVAICKDMDFPEYIREYSKNNVSVMFVPAWDFEVDDWLHSRMSILRSVENGFSQVRCARRGQLTINDPYGRVTFEKKYIPNNDYHLLGSVTPDTTQTFYAKNGDWFGILNLLMLIILISISFLKSRISNLNKRRNRD